MNHFIGNFTSNDAAARMVIIAKNLIDRCVVKIAVINRPTASRVDITGLGDFMIGKHDHIELTMVDPLKRTDQEFASKLGVLLRCAILLGGVR